MSSNSNGSKAPGILRTVFGIVMIVIYIGMGILLFCGFFDNLFYGSWSWVKWAGGAMLIVYGIWRGYRQFAGIDPNPYDKSDR